jgi:hypothetical protein
MTDELKKEHKLLRLACVAATLALWLLLSLGFPHAAMGQSGRRRNKEDVPSPPPPTPTPTPRQTSTPTRRQAPTQRLPPGVVPTSIIIGGRLIVDQHYYRSNDVAVAIKEAMQDFRMRTKLTPMKAGTKMTRTQAIERAKKEQDAYVLLLEIRVHVPDMGPDSISRIDYFLLIPRTGALMLEGKVDPRTLVQTIDGMPIPGSRPKGSFEELLRGVEEVVERVRERVALEP